MKSSIQISTEKSQLNVKRIHDFLSNQSYWAKGRSLETVKQSIENSLCFGVYIDGQQVGFARVVTDYAVFAWIMDVFIDPNFRGQGLGKKLMQAITTHEKLQTLYRWGLATTDAHGLYEQFGFKPLGTPHKMMEILCE